MGTKKNMSLSVETVEFLEARKMGPDNQIRWSPSVNSMFNQVRWILSQELPDLKNEEWQVIFNTYVGIALGGFHPPFRIASDVMDNNGEVDINNLDDKIANTIKKVHKLSQVQQWAIMDMVQKFWSRGDREIDSFEDEINELKKL